MKVFVNSHRLSTTRAKREKTLIDSHEKFEHIKVDKSAREFQAEREREFELSSTLILVWPGIKNSAVLKEVQIWSEV